MKRTFANKKTALAGLACGLLLLSACATSTVNTEAGSSDPSSLVEARAMARWDALLSGDLAAAYEYLSPGFRSSVSSLQYQRSILLKKVKWTSAEIIESKCEETICNVEILLGFTVYGALPGVSKFEDTEQIYETWVLVDGKWYLVPEK